MSVLCKKLEGNIFLEFFFTKLQCVLHWYFILVDSLPMHRGSDFDGVRALPSLPGNGAYLQCKKRFYELSCNSITCNWSYMDQELTTAVKYPVMMYLP